jgi:hypothetical protein
MIQIPAFDKRKDLHTFLRENKKVIFATKKAEIKYADGVFSNPFVNVEHEIIMDIAQKSVVRQSSSPAGIGDMPLSFSIEVVINTTNIMDSHSDVHFPNLWNKSLKENKMIMLLQEHIMQFDHIISRKVSPSARMMTWKELGYKFPGETQALVFSSVVESKPRAYMINMADEYWNGNVTNHSVGMRYMSLMLAMNSESKWDEEEKANWDKYIDQIVNRDVVEEQGYFYPVLEAKVIEGSAVPLGSNFATPTISIGKDQALPEAVKDTSDEPQINWSKIAKAIKN